MKLSITFEQFMKYKSVNHDMLSQLRSFANNLNYKQKKRPLKNKWNKNEPIEINWMMKKKYDNSESENLQSQIKGLLNKLALNNFNDILIEFNKIQEEILTYDDLNFLVHLIFNKAVRETKFCELYANLCKGLLNIKILFNDKQIKFREILLKYCQKSFYENISYNKDDDNIDLFYIKGKILGCIKFIGELYNLNIIPHKVIVACFNDLISHVNKNIYMVDSICCLMMTCGLKMSKCNPNDVNILFNKFNFLKKSISLPEKFALMDLDDIKNKW